MRTLFEYDFLSSAGKAVAMRNNALARKLGKFVALSETELSVLDELNKRRRTFVAGRDIVEQGQTEQSAYVLASGWACSYKLLQDGQRQIVDFQIPGDFLGLRSLLMHVSDHSVEQTHITLL
jgi:CRP-like cAMP-binding protein